MKKSKKRIYEWTFYSKHAITSEYKYQDIYQDFQDLIREKFNKDCVIYMLGSRVMGIGHGKESDLDIFLDIGNISLKLFWKRR
jgi:hypothetical protein